MKNSVAALAIIASFAVGTIVTGSTVYAADKPNGQPFDAVWQAIGLLQTQIDEIELSPGPQGEPGPTGNDGSSCSISGTIVSCTDGTSSDVQGPRGEDGTSGDLTELESKVELLYNYVSKRGSTPSIGDAYVENSETIWSVLEGEEILVTLTNLSDYDTDVEDIIVTWEVLDDYNYQNTGTATITVLDQTTASIIVDDMEAQSKGEIENYSFKVTAENIFGKTSYVIFSYHWIETNNPIPPGVYYVTEIYDVPPQTSESFIFYCPNGTWDVVVNDYDLDSEDWNENPNPRVENYIVDLSGGILTDLSVDYYSDGDGRDGRILGATNPSSSPEQFQVDWMCVQ